MAKESLVRLTCDRCEKTIIEEPNVAGPKPPTAAPVPLLVLEAPGLGLPGRIMFDDLCDGCKKRVVSLIGQIRLDPSQTEAKEAEVEVASPADKNGAPTAGNQESEASKKKRTGLRDSTV